MDDRTDRRASVLAVAAVAGPFALLLARVAAVHGRLYQQGDLALADLAVRRAMRWHQLLGAYDRFGWHHPGPLWFYLVGALARVLGGAGLRSETAAAVVVDGLAAAGCVWLVGRLMGARAALVSAGLLGAAVVALGPVALWHAWTPYVVVLPTVLLCILAAGAAGGSGACLGAAALVATFCVQADLGVAPLAAVLTLGAGAGWLARRAPWRGWRPAVPALLLAGAAVLCWLPPAIEQVEGSPGNVTLVWRFLTATHHRAGWSAAAVVERAQLGPVGLGRAGTAGLVVVAAIGAGAVLVGRRRARPAAHLGVLCLAGSGVALAAGAAVVGPVYGYLVAWSVAPLLAGAVGLAGAATLRSAAGRPRRWVPVAAAVVMLAGTGALWGRVAALPGLSRFSAGAVGRAWSALGAQLPPPGATVHLDIRDASGWALAAGLADELDRSGRWFTVAPEWAYQYGGDRVGGAGTVVALARPGDPPVGRVVGVWDGIRVSVRAGR